MSFFQQKIAKKFNSTNSDIMGKCKWAEPHLPAIPMYHCVYLFPGRMNNSAQSVDVVKDCFGMTKVRKNKSLSNMNHTEEKPGTNEGGAGSSPIDDEEFHWQIVARILFIYAKLNPGQGYVQGMNEIIGPLYYVFANDPKDTWSGKSIGLSPSLIYPHFPNYNQLMSPFWQITPRRTLSGASRA